MPLRKGRETYGAKYDQAIKLHQEGLSPKQISEQLKISYSCAYHWVKGLRKPEQGNVSDFVELLRSSGPLPVVDVKNKFPKHNELFLIASRRGLPLARRVLDKKLFDYSVWYFLEGQEHELDNRINQLYEKMKNVRSMLDK